MHHRREVELWGQLGGRRQRLLGDCFWEGSPHHSLNGLLVKLSKWPRVCVLAESVPRKGDPVLAPHCK